MVERRSMALVLLYGMPGESIDYRVPIFKSKAVTSADWSR